MGVTFRFQHVLISVCFLGIFCFHVFVTIDKPSARYLQPRRRCACRGICDWLFVGPVDVLAIAVGEVLLVVPSCLCASVLALVGLVVPAMPVAPFSHSPSAVPRAVAILLVARYVPCFLLSFVLPLLLHFPVSPQLSLKEQFSHLANVGIGGGLGCFRFICPEENGWRGFGVVAGGAVSVGS